MSASMVRAMLMICALLVMPATGIAEPIELGELGRLFYTPAERASISGARSREGSTVAMAEAEAATAPAVSLLRLNGVVERSGRPSLAWINERAVEHGDSVLGYQVHTERNAVRLTDQQGRSVRLSVGQLMDIDSRRILDPLGAGEVRASSR